MARANPATWHPPPDLNAKFIFYSDFLNPVFVWEHRVRALYISSGLKRG